MIRLVSAAVLVVVVLTTIWLLPLWATAVVAAAIAAAASGELARLAARLGAEPPAGFVSLATATLVIAFVIPWPTLGGVQAGSLGSVLLALPVAAGVVALSLGPPDAAAFLRVAVMTMAPLYIGLPLGALTWIHWTWGPAATTWLLAIIALSDSAQYYSGRAFGRRKLAPAVSPGKTVEGALGGLVAVTVGGMLLTPWCLPGVNAFGGAVIAVAVAGFGLLGDLFESAIKRSVGVKDSSDFIPGHGGVLDRIDAYLFAVPLFYLVVRHLV